VGAVSFSPPPPYRAVRVLGQGGMGEVWEVVHAQTQVRYALKRILQADAVDELRFEREAQALASLNSPHVVRVHSAGIHEGAPYLVQEFLSAGSLAERLRHGPLAPGEARRVVGEVALGLAAAHAEGILHRDLKPDNVLFDEAGRAKVADFGLARREGDLQERLTQTGEILGTPAYMAPEQAVDSSRADARADVYALGAILYACLTGRPPIPAAGRTLIAQLAALQDERPPAPSSLRPGLPADLDALCLAALEKDPEERLPSTAAFLEGLRAEATSPGGSHALLWGAGLLVLALAAFSIWIVASRDQPSPAPTPRARASVTTPSPRSSPTSSPKRRRLSKGFNLRRRAWKGRLVVCVSRGREFLTLGGGEVSRWDAETGEHLGSTEAYPENLPLRHLASLPQGGLLAASQRPAMLTWYSLQRGVIRSEDTVRPTALTIRSDGGAVVGDLTGGVTFFDAAGTKDGERYVALGPGGFCPPGRDELRPQAIRALYQPRPDRLLLVGSPTEEQVKSLAGSGAMTGWALLFEVRGSVLTAVLDSLEVPGARCLALDTERGALVVGKGVGSIDLLALEDGEGGPVSRLREVRRNLWSLSPFGGESTSWGAVFLLPGARRLIAIGGGQGSKQNLLMTCQVSEGSEPPPHRRLTLDRKPISLAVCVETRTILVCGNQGLARWVPFEELEIE
jgi:serine/threonine protein kinase